ncbi:hypothetical protein OROMI_004884 [Orobanche minor]
MVSTLTALTPSPRSSFTLKVPSRLSPQTSVLSPETVSALRETLTRESKSTTNLLFHSGAVTPNFHGHKVAASIEPVISPIMLSMWASHVSDPFISIDALEVLEAIKRLLDVFILLASRVIPYIGPILSIIRAQGPLRSFITNGYVAKGVIVSLSPYKLVGNEELGPASCYVKVIVGIKLDKELIRTIGSVKKSGKL